MSEGGVIFSTPTSDMNNINAISTKEITVSFTTGSSTLSDESKYKIDKEFLNVAQNFANSRIRIAGNTDNTGNYNNNVYLSKQRAQAVADYLSNEHGFDRNRFIVIGNGPNNPVSDNNTELGRSKNRRTRIVILPQLDQFFKLLEKK